MRKMMTALVSILVLGTFGCQNDNTGQVSETGMTALTIEGVPIACEVDADCTEYVNPDQCVRGAECLEGFCQALISESCLEGDGKDKHFETTACGGDWDCVDDGNPCTDEVCNPYLFGGACTYPASDLPVITCGVGECEVSIPACDGWNPTEEVCEPGEPTTDDNCDGLDQDCDGEVDEHYMPEPTICGLGECEGNVGQMTCVDGGFVDTCDPLDGAIADDNCNGQDDNCNGATDENYVPTATECGLGECVSTGQMTCVDGGFVDTCVIGPTTGDDSDCDGKDDNCNGATDENYVPTATDCGEGVCVSAGEMTCVDGGFFNTCVPGPTTGDDSDCNGLDEDCDGVADEHYVPTGTTCGLGECAAIGDLTCVSGSEVDSCVSGEPTPDTNCNGLDEDCDGVADEHYEPTATDCGLGDCAAIGDLTCVGGSEVDSCVSGDPTPDTNCNGLDEDCDGVADEGYVSTPTTCGVGECEDNVGQVECIAGEEVDTCDEFAGSDDETCDELDNDCDGLIDEDEEGVEGEACSSCYELNLGPNLECGGVYDGTSGFENTLDGYSCRPSYIEDGFERVYPFMTSLGGVRVTVMVSDLMPSTDVDYFLLEETCDPDACVGWGNTMIVFQPEVDVSYLLAIDEYETLGADLTYQVQVTCVELDCEDGLDNDNDGLVDCDDDDCSCP